MLQAQPLPEEIKPFDDSHIGKSEMQKNFRMDLRAFSEKEYNKYVKVESVRDW